MADTKYRKQSGRGMSQGYHFADYADLRRWISYYIQIKEAVSNDCRSFLVIGAGDGIVPCVIKHIMEEKYRNGDVLVHTFDCDEELNPDITGDVKDICRLIGNRRYDCVLACQVLEHLEYKYFRRIIKQISRICKKRFVLSLPVSKISVSFWIDLPKIHNKYWNIVIQRFWKREFLFDGQHYWEAGIRNHSKKDIIMVCSEFFRVTKTEHPPLHPYHWFVVMDKQS